MTEEMLEYGLLWSGYNLPSNLEIFVGDMTGNGQDEVVAVHPTGSIYIFRYDGRVFRRFSALNLGRRITKAVIGDIDGDGLKELIVASGNVFIVFKWRGNRFERVFVSTGMEANITDISVGDLTGNFVEDIVIVEGRNKIKVFESKNKGFILIAEKKYQMSVKIEVGNVAGIEKKQIIVLETAATAGGDRLEVLGVFEGQFKMLMEAGLGMRADKLLAVKDVDDNYRDEVIISVSNGRRILIMENVGNRLSRKWLSAGFSVSIGDVEVADWDKDGKNELFVAVGSRVFVFKLRGREFVNIKTIEMDLTLVSFSKGDVERDGFIEVVVVTVTGIIVIVKDFFEAKSQFLVQQTVYIPKKLPPAIKVAEVKVDKVMVFRKESIKGKVIVSGKFLVNILYVAKPDRRVFAFDVEIPFTHFIPIPNLRPGQKILVDVDVEYVDFRFNPAKPREIEVVIVAQVVAYDIINKKRQPLSGVAKEYNVSVKDIARINKLKEDQEIAEGEKIKLPV